MSGNQSIQHRLLINSSKTSPSAHSGSNYFAFGDFWQSVDEAQSSGAFPSSVGDLVTLFDSDTTHKEGDEGKTRREAILYFNGTGVTLYGSMLTKTCTKEPDYESKLIIDGVPIVSDQNDHSDSGVLVNLADLYQPGPNKTHTLALHFDGPCTINVYFALVDLTPESVIEQHSAEEIFLAGLMMAPDDELILYEGNWTAGPAASYVGNKSMRTKETGVSMSFIFFGSSICIIGESYSKWAISVSVDNGTPISFNEGHFPGYVIFESANLPLDPSSTPAAPHTVNITVTDLDLLPYNGVSGPVFAPYLEIRGIMYAPRFSSLAEGNSMLSEWRSGLSETSAQTARDTRERQAHHTAATAGGVVGGCIGLTLIVGLVVWLRRRQTRFQSDLRHSTDRDSSIQIYRPNSGILWSTEDATLPTNRDFDPYMETTSQDNGEYTGYTTLNPCIHHNTLTRPETITPYMKFYHPTGPYMGMRDPTTAVPYMKRYDLLPVVLPSREAREDKETSPISFEPPPSSGSHVRSPREFMGLPEQQSVLVGNTEHNAPLPSEIPEPVYQLWHQHTTGDDTESTEGGTIEPENPAAMRRVLRMMESMRARVDALEQPPPYVAAQAGVAPSGGG